jgi:hypothetical protein
MVEYVMNDKLERIWKELAMALSKYHASPKSENPKVLANI